ncbi:hypothetical protein ACQ4PT_036306 [Festuca glaucescens]
MPSWGDCEYSSPSILGDLVEADYAPDMYEDPIFHRIVTCCLELVKHLSDEKNKIKKNYGTLLNDVKKFIKETQKKMVEQNFKKIKSGEANKDYGTVLADLKVVEKDRDVLKTEGSKLRSELKELKQVHKSQADVMKEKKLRWEGERDALKEEKRKVEYMLYDMFKASDCLKEKVKKIRAICDD